MPPPKPTKPPQQPLIEGGSEKPAALRRAQDAAEHVFSRHLKPRAEQAAKALGPLVERGARAALVKLADPARARLLQRSMAGLAQWTMDTGFELDPDAGLLFEFVDTLEQAHSREVVFKMIARHASSYERDMLALMLKATRGADGSGRGGFAHAELPAILREFLGQNAGSHAPPNEARSQAERAQDAEAFRRQRERLSDALLEFLCDLASLEADAPPPFGRAAQLAYFEEAPIDARFKRLAGMAAGDPEAFLDAGSTEATGAHPETDAPKTDAQARAAAPSLRAKISGSRLGRFVRGNLQGAVDDAPDAPKKPPPQDESEGMLGRFIPSFSDPATRFLTTSHLFFLQSYLMRSTIEGLPDMLATVADLEREVELSQEDIMTMDPSDDAEN